ncbi:MAG: nucleotidyltransferase family protein [Fimbriimonadaceae bacterium]
MSELSSIQRQTILKTARQFGVVDIKVFGSRATGRADLGSDIDLLVRFEGKATLLTVIGFQQSLESDLGTKVDVVEYDGLSPFMSARILSEAVPL